MAFFVTLQEDIMEEPAPRMFWPKAIWGKYGSSLADFKEAGNREAAIKCLNHMVRERHSCEAAILPH